MNDKQAEIFVKKYLPELVKKSTRIFPEKLDKLTEGQDYASIDISGGNGNIEIKCWGSFLSRDNDGDKNRGGSVLFEIFHTWKDAPIEEIYAGWLLSAYHPEEYCTLRDRRGNNKKAELPGLYTFLTLGSNAEPFACIAFEDIPALLERLRGLCPDPDGWGINNLHQLRPAADREYWRHFETYNEAYGKVFQNMWYVPFKYIYDLSTITMINDVDPEKELKTKLAAARYNSLQWVADRQGRGEHFYPGQYQMPKGQKVDLDTDEHTLDKNSTALFVKRANEFMKQFGLTFESDDIAVVKYEPKKEDP